jgi:hypothetical protein
VLRGSVSCRWCASWRSINLRTPAEARSPRRLQPLRDSGNNPKGLFRSRSRSRLRCRYRAGGHQHRLYPTRRGLTRNPTGRLLPHASVSGSVSPSESKTKRSRMRFEPALELDPDPGARGSGGIRYPKWSPS